MIVKDADILCYVEMSLRASTHGCRRGVAITINGSIIKGEYDGYGNLDGREADLMDSAIWHDACWRKAGSPTEYGGVSRASKDQGFFFEDGAHDMPEPR